LKLKGFTLLDHEYSESHLGVCSGWCVQQRISSLEHVASSSPILLFDKVLYLLLFFSHRKLEFRLW